MNRFPTIPLGDRIRLISYGLLAGLIMGAIIGWMFHGVVGLVVKLFIVALLLVPAVLAFLFWQRVTGKRDAAAKTDVRDADWAEIDAGGRPRQ